MTRQLKKAHKLNKGFTLLEMAIVLAIVGLILGALLIPMSTQISMRDNRQTQINLGLIKEALIGYAVSNNRLPCPDTDFDGLENATPDVVPNTPQDFICVNDEGTLPYKTLGVESSDVWGNYFGYRIATNFSKWSQLLIDGQSSYKFFTLASTGSIKINSRGDNPANSLVEAKSITPLTTNAAAVIISYGRNGYGAFNKANTSQNEAPPAINVDETTNATKGVVKVSRVHTDKLADCSDTDESKSFCEFDDIVDWISPNILFNRMVAAGKLP